MKEPTVCRAHPPLIVVCLLLVKLDICVYYVKSFLGHSRHSGVSLAVADDLIRIWGPGYLQPLSWPRPVDAYQNCSNFMLDCGAVSIRHQAIMKINDDNSLMQWKNRVFCNSNGLSMHWCGKAPENIRVFNMMSYLWNCNPAMTLA